MRILKRLALALASIGFVLYAIAIYFDPEGFYALFKSSSTVVEGSAARLDDFSSSSVSEPSGDPWQIEEGAGDVVAAFNVKRPPPDESHFDPGFLAFRDALRSAIAARDLATVLSFTDENILLSYGGDEGRAVFETLLEEPDVGEGFWMQLEDVLSFASVPRGGEGYCAPYIFCAGLPDALQDVDPFETAFIVREEVKVFAAPVDDTDIIATLSFDAVQLGPFMNDPNWVEIVLTDGRSGFVARDHVRMSVGYQANFEKTNDRWQMVAFATSD